MLISSKQALYKDLKTFQGFIKYKKTKYLFHFLKIFRSHAIIQLRIEKQKLGNESRLASPSSSYGMKTPDFDFSDDEEEGHDSFNSSMVRPIFSLL